MNITRCMKLRRITALCLFYLLILIIVCIPPMCASESYYGDGYEEDGETAQEESGQDDDGWYSIESAYFTIYYKPTADLKSMEKKLKKRSFYMRGSARPDPYSEPEEKVAFYLDRLFQRAKQILEMRPPNMHVNIEIFSTREDLDNKYYDIFREEASVKAFYVYRFDTIYTSEEDISDSVMAHEMAHSIVDHYFVVRPPEKLREMISCFVDMHLEE